MYNVEGFRLLHFLGAVKVVSCKVIIVVTTKIDYVMYNMLDNNCRVAGYLKDGNILIDFFIACKYSKSRSLFTLSCPLFLLSLHSTWCVSSSSDPSPNFGLFGQNVYNF